jgi:hypothetical protein
MRDETYLILGGGGMTGFQVADAIARDLNPARIVVAALTRREADEAVTELRRRHEDPSAVRFASDWGDIFIRAEWNPPEAGEPVRRRDLLASPESRAQLFEDLFGDLDPSYERSHLVQMVRRHEPDVIVDSINTATGISYQDLPELSRATRQAFARASADLGAGRLDGQAALSAIGPEIESLVLSQSVPELVRHVLLLHRVMKELQARTGGMKPRLYLKVGTTGTGGMGLNIPYTHSEDKPSENLMAKSAIAFAQTGLLFLMARTPGSPVVKEVKPGAMIGWKAVGPRSITRGGRPVFVYRSQVAPLGGALVPDEAPDGFEQVGSDPLRMLTVDTGENGVFGRAEFEAITHLRQMEFITPEEIADQAVLEIKGSNTGYDVIAAIDSSVMNPTYRGAYLRPVALRQLTAEERRLAGDQTICPSVAHGQLGPPELGKLLWEAYLLQLECQTLERVLEYTPQQLSDQVSALLGRQPRLADFIAAVGLPILSADGRSLRRGPFVRIPKLRRGESARVTDGAVNEWARKGWVDLRPSCFETWRSRFARILEESHATGGGSAAIVASSYLFEENMPELSGARAGGAAATPISLGAIAAWVFINEADGARIK